MKREILSNISFNFLIRMISYLFSFLTMMYVARVLKPDAYGQVGFAQSFVSYFTMIASFGMPIYGARICAEKRENRAELSRVFDELWSIEVLLAFISWILLLLAIFTIPKIRENSSLFMICGLSICFQMIDCEWAYKGLEKFKYLAVSSFICKLISFISIILLVRSEGQILLYSAIIVFSSGGNNIINFYHLRKYIDFPLKLKLSKKHFKHLSIFFIMSCATLVYSSLDLVMLGFMKSDYEIGIYQLAAKGRNVLTITGGLVWSSILPRATQLWIKGDKLRFKALAENALLAVTGIQLLVMLFSLIFAKDMILIAGGKDYLGAVSSFRILVISLLPVGASNIRRSGSDTCRKREKTPYSRSSRRRFQFFCKSYADSSVFHHWGGMDNNRIGNNSSIGLYILCKKGSGHGFLFRTCEKSF